MCDLTSNSDLEPDERDEKIAALEANLLRLQQDKELLLHLMQEINRRD